MRALNPSLLHKSNWNGDTGYTQRSGGSEKDVSELSHAEWTAGPVLAVDASALNNELPTGAGLICTWIVQPGENVHEKLAVSFNPAGDQDPSLDSSTKDVGSLWKHTVRKSRYRLLHHFKFKTPNFPQTFSLPKCKLYSHQQQFIKRSIKTEQSWVQLIGAVLCSSPSFSHGNLGKSVAHLWSESKRRRRAGMQTRRDSKHKLFLLCRGLCFPCSDLRRAGWPWLCDRRDLRHFKHQSPAEMNQGRVEEVRECVLHVATAWNCTQSRCGAKGGFLCWRYPQSWCCEVDLWLPAHRLPRTGAFFKTLSSFCERVESKDSNMNKTATLRGEPRPPADKPAYCSTCWTANVVANMAFLWRHESQ